MAKIDPFYVIFATHVGTHKLNVPQSLYKLFYFFSTQKQENTPTSIDFVKVLRLFTITDKIGEKSCCNNCDTSKGYTAGVQVLDANGKIIKKSLEGFNGLKVGDNVIIKGKANKMTTDTSLQLTATGIYIDK